MSQSNDRFLPLERNVTTYKLKLFIKKKNETSLRNRTGLSIIRAQASEMAEWACSLVCYERVITKTDKTIKLSVCMFLNKRNLFPSS